MAGYTCTLCNKTCHISCGQPCECHNNDMREKLCELFGNANIFAANNPVKFRLIKQHYRLEEYQKLLDEHYTKFLTVHQAVNPDVMLFFRSPTGKSYFLISGRSEHILEDGEEILLNEGESIIFKIPYQTNHEDHEDHTYYIVEADKFAYHMQENWQNWRD